MSGRQVDIGDSHGRAWACGSGDPAVGVDDRAAFGPLLASFDAGPVTAGDGDLVGREPSTSR